MPAAAAPKTRRPARVEAIIARDAPLAVILRRGPTRLVRMLRWNLRKDTIAGGQWINARVPARCVDVSPSGDLVACFVASYRQGPGTWTTISRPPYFTALAVWPKGDTWGGGGLFVSDRRLLLDHDRQVKYGVDQFALLPDFALPKRFRVEEYREHTPPRHDIEHPRMALSGWRVIQPALGRMEPNADLHYPYDPPEIMARTLDDPKHPRFQLRRFVLGHSPRQWRAAHRMMRAEVHDLKVQTHHDIGFVGWVDADHNGDVLWSRQGRLFRLAGSTRQGMKVDAEPKLVADLNAMTFEAIEAPKSALKWP
jgi:hypothetical protein